MGTIHKSVEFEVIVVQNKLQHSFGLSYILLISGLCFYNQGIPQIQRDMGAVNTTNFNNSEPLP